MEITPKQLVFACVAIFAGIVGINLAVQLREQGDLKARLADLDLNDFKDKFVKQEFNYIEPPEIIEEVVEEVSTEET